MAITKFTIKQEEGSPLDLQIEGMAFGVKAAVCPRAKLRKIEKHGVYILLDARRLCCYVGESSKDQQGVWHRVHGHDKPGEAWWTHSVMFYEPFDNAPADLMLWCEWRLFTLASRRMVVVSTAQKRAEPEGGSEVLRKILLLCAVLGIPISEECPQPRQDELRFGEGGSRNPTGQHLENTQRGKGNFWALKVANSVGLPKAPGGLASHVSGTWQLPDNSKWRPVFKALGLYRDDGTLKSMDEFPPVLPVLPADVLDEFHRHDRRATRIIHAPR